MTPTRANKSNSGLQNTHRGHPARRIEIDYEKSTGKQLTEIAMNETKQSRYLSIEQLVERYGGAISKNTLQFWRLTRRGPGWIRAGRRILYPLAEVERWETQRRIRTRNRPCN